MYLTKGTSKMVDGSNPSATVSDYLCDIQLLHFIKYFTIFQYKSIFRGTVDEIFDYASKYSNMTHYDVKSVGNDEYIGGVMISEKTRPPPPSLKSQEAKEDRSG